MVLEIGQPITKGQESEITSGGPGSSDDKCCGVTTEILKDPKTGETYFRISTEGWRAAARKHGEMEILCSNKAGGEGGAPSCGGNVVAPDPENNPNLQLTWYAQRNPTTGGFTYCGKLNDLSSR